MGRFEYLTRRYPFEGYLAFVSWFLKYLPSLGTSQSEGVRGKSQSRRYCGRLAEMGFPQRDGIGVWCQARTPEAQFRRISYTGSSVSERTMPENLRLRPPGAAPAERS